MPPRLATKRVAAPEAEVVAKVTGSTTSVPSDAEILAMIAQAAYYRAEKRGFQPGPESEDWVQAEAEVRARLQAMRGHP